MLQSSPAMAGRQETCPICQTINRVPRVSTASKPRTPVQRYQQPKSQATAMIVVSTLLAIGAAFAFFAYMAASKPDVETNYTDATDPKQDPDELEVATGREDRVLYSVDPTDTEGIRRHEQKQTMTKVWKELTDQRWAPAIRMLTEMGEPDKHKEDYWYALGYAYSGNQEDDKALSAFHRAIVVNDKYDSAYLHLGLTYGRLGEIRDAEKWLGDGMKLRPDDPHFEYAFGHMYHGNKMYRKAIKWFEIASKRGGEGPLGRQARARLREINRILGVD
ncbi:MAG: tetratricopeptide repeat protein [Phycisphaerae bacterium]